MIGIIKEFNKKRSPLTEKIKKTVYLFNVEILKNSALFCLVNNERKRVQGNSLKKNCLSFKISKKMGLKIERLLKPPGLNISL